MDQYGIYQIEDKLYVLLKPGNEPKNAPGIISVTKNCGSCHIQGLLWNMFDVDPGQPLADYISGTLGEKIDKIRDINNQIGQILEINPNIYSDAILVFVKDKPRFFNVPVAPASYKYFLKTFAALLIRADKLDRQTVVDLFREYYDVDLCPPETYGICPD